MHQSSGPSFQPQFCDAPQTKRGHERRLSLLISATELFLEKGYDAVSLDDLVQHAGGSKASIYKYFGSKDGLFRAIFDYRRDLFFKNICSTFDCAHQDLRSYLINTMYVFYKKLSCGDHTAFMRLVIERAQSDPDLAQYVYEYGLAYIEQAVADALAQATHRGQIYCPNPLGSSQLYFGILRSLEWKSILGLPIIANEDIVNEHINYCVDQFLRGHQVK